MCRSKKSIFLALYSSLFCFDSATFVDAPPLAVTPTGPAFAPMPAPAVDSRFSTRDFLTLTSSEECNSSFSCLTCSSSSLTSLFVAALSRGGRFGVVPNSFSRSSSYSPAHGPPHGANRRTLCSERADQDAQQNVRVCMPFECFEVDERDRPPIDRERCDSLSQKARLAGPTATKNNVVPLRRRSPQP